MRDSSVYALSILLMMWAMRDGVVSALEGGVLVATYVLYVVVMMFNGKMVEMLTAREKRLALEEHRKGGLDLDLNGPAAPVESTAAAVGSCIGSGAAVAVLRASASQ